MFTGNEKFILSGAKLSKPFFDMARDLSGEDSARIILDLSPSPNRYHFERDKELLISLMAKNSITNYVFMESSFCSEEPSDEIKEKIETADILCVGGGSSRHAIARWNGLGITDQIKQRVSEGKLVASGGSAGAIIWFDRGYSDSLQYEVEDGQEWDYILVDGTQALPGWVNPHHSDTDTSGRVRSNGYQNTLRHHTQEWTNAFGIDKAAALICVGGLISSLGLQETKELPDQSVYIYKHSLDGAISQKTLEQGETLDLANM